MTVTRFSGWRLEPQFFPDGPARPEVLALDDTNLTVWIGDPPVVWQTPLSEAHDLTVSLGRRIRVFATIGGVRYCWSRRREPEHDQLVDVIRAHGGRVARDRRRRVTIALIFAAVVLVSSAATFASYVSSPTTSTESSARLDASVAAVNVQQGDLPSGWTKQPDDIIEAILGTPGSIQTSPFPTTSPTNVYSEIFAAAGARFQSCLGVSAASDRMFGQAGQEPKVEITGTLFSSAAFGGSEIGSLTQYYASTSMVNKDVAEYTRAGFGRCWGVASAQLLEGSLSETVAPAKASYATVQWTPATFAPGFRRGGVSTITLPTVSGTYSLVSFFAARGHDEVNLYALTGDLTKARPTIVAAFEALLARLSPVSTNGAA